jgi:hypothetical protein
VITGRSAAIAGVIDPNRFFRYFCAKSWLDRFCQRLRRAGSQSAPPVPPRHFSDDAEGLSFRNGWSGVAFGPSGLCCRESISRFRTISRTRDRGDNVAIMSQGTAGLV